MKRIILSLLVASLPFAGVHAEAPKAKNAKLTLVYQHELPDVPGKSLKGVLVETIYKAGQNFSDMPGDRHRVSANASTTEPARLLAVFVVDTNEKELTTPFD